MNALEEKIGLSVWKLAVGSIGAISILVGAIYWASSVDSTAKQALKLGEMNSAQIERLSLQLQTQNTSLTEMRVDIRYVITTLNELKQDINKGEKSNGRK